MPRTIRASSTTSHGGSTPGQEKLWDGTLPLNSSFQKEPSTSSGTGQLDSNLLHLELESTHPISFDGSRAGHPAK